MTDAPVPDTEDTIIASHWHRQDAMPIAAANRPRPFQPN